MRRTVLMLLVVMSFVAACAPTTLPTPAPTKDTRPTVTPLGAAAPTNGVTPASTLPTTVPPIGATAASPTSPLSTPAQQSPLPTPALQSPLPTPSGEARTLTVLTHESFAISDEVLQQFEQTNNVKVQFIKQGDAGQALTRAILTKDNPEADVLFGVDNTFMSRALEAELFEAYQPIGWENVPPEFKLDPTQQLIPIDYGDVCLNYDKAYFAEQELTPPQTLADLTKPEFGYPYDPDDGRENQSVPDTVLRVLRGGSFRRGARDVRCACRGRSYPDLRFDDLGFRVVSPGF